MIELMDFEESGEANDRVVQMALREIDESVLARAAVAMDETEREIVYRNMSERACKLLAEDVEREEGRVSRTAAAKAKEFFLQKLKKYREYMARQPSSPRLPEKPPAVVTDTEEAIIETFAQLVRYARVKGNLALEGADLSAAHPLARKGVELVVDGWDPVLIRDILEQMKETELAGVTRRLQMILEGIESLMSGDVPLVVEERLRAFLPPTHQ